VKTNLKKLATDYADALTAAAKRTEGMPDEGTFNFDSTVLFGLRYTAKVAAILGPAAHSSTWYGKRVVMISPERGSQNVRSSAAQEMTKLFRERGYDATTYFQMD